LSYAEAECKIGETIERFRRSTTSNLLLLLRSQIDRCCEKNNNERSCLSQHHVTA